MSERTVVYVGLDTAKWTGIAAWNPLVHAAEVVQVKGEPVEQLLFISQHILNYAAEHVEFIFVMEKQHNFRNATTARSLLERYGYLKYSLLSIGYEVREAGPHPVRKNICCKSKEETFRRFIPFYEGDVLTDNHTDALALALWASAQDGYETNWIKMRIVDMKRGAVK